MISQTIGWTLIHSLWEGLLIFILVKISMQFTKRADVRYGIGVAGLGLIVVCAVVTFLMLNVKTTSEGFNLIITAKATGTAPQSILSWIDSNIIWLLRFWILGLTAGLLRIAAGLWYINRLRRNASPVQAEWLEIVKDLSTTLNITRVVTMAEAAIASPMVVGFVKPMILFPVGLLAGLTTEQVETILVHELSHIRRQDYIINLVQSVIETIFFFNPFTLLISSLIREERENCCDDLVIAKGISPISYVKTLAQLEAARSSSTLALGIAGNQNQLLNRIKRIMENSAKNDWGKGRLVPVALLFLGLICASWLSIGSEKKEKEVSAPHTVLASDTSKKDGLKVLKKKDNYWVPAQPAEPAIPAVPEEMPEYFEFPPVPDVDFNFDEMAQVPHEFELPISPDMYVPAIPGFEYNFFDSDSIPAYRFQFRDLENWDAFEKEFKEKFKSEFKDFYNKNHEQLDKMMDEMRKNHGEARVKREAAEVVDLNNLAHEKMAMQEIYGADAAALLGKLSAMSAQAQAERALRAADLVKIAAGRDMLVMNEKLLANTEMFEEMSRRYAEFDKAITEQLIADGYLKSGEHIDQLQMNDENGKMTINGKSIKEKDRIKYKALQDKYLKASHMPLIPGRSE